MKSKHTPGPWRVKLGNGIYAGNSYLSLVLTENQLVGDLPYKANARLMAAAPEMFEVLKDLLEWGTGVGMGYDEATYNAEKLIAKIEEEENR